MTKKRAKKTAKKLTPGKKAALTTKRRAAAKKAVGTKKRKAAGLAAGQTRRRNQIAAAVRAGLAAVGSGDLVAARTQFEAIARLVP